MMLLIALHNAAAFDPADHRGMAARAVVLEAEALGEQGPIAARLLPLGAANEDWNLARKWTRWHHYYPLGFSVHPLGRRSSEERVASLEADLRGALAVGDVERVWLLAGFLAHHLQDMASPPHVVPVAHGLGDGFESYPFVALVAAAGAAEVPDLPPIEAQRALATATDAALREPLVCTGEVLAWSRFWVPGVEGFGHRGDLVFGVVPGCEVGTEAFARARVEDAVAYTRAVIRHVLALQETP